MPLRIFLIGKKHARNLQTPCQKKYFNMRIKLIVSLGFSNDMLIFLKFNAIASTGRQFNFHYTSYWIIYSIFVIRALTLTRLGPFVVSWLYSFSFWASLMTFGISCPLLSLLVFWQRTLWLWHFQDSAITYRSLLQETLNICCCDSHFQND